MAYNPSLPLQNSDIVKGSMLQVKIGDDILGFATSHSLSINTSTTEISTKDHGDYPAILPQNVTWEVTCENLYTDANVSALLAIQNNKTKVYLSFGKVTNYNATNERGIVGDHADQDHWTISGVAGGEAYLTSFQLNAPNGDNATISCTFTGCGALYNV